jgi:hypothetical protein
MATELFGWQEKSMTEILQVDPADRANQLEAVLDEMLLKIMINLNHRGYGTKEILTALGSVCAKRRNAYEEDPDPAEDP